MEEHEMVLEKRTARFAARCINVCEAISGNHLGSEHIKDQLFRSSTSIAANYAEAEESESRKDFIHKMKVAMKELAETRMWLRIISECGYIESEKLVMSQSR